MRRTTRPAQAPQKTPDLSRYPRPGAVDPSPDKITTPPETRSKVEARGEVIGALTDYLPRLEDRLDAERLRADLASAEADELKKEVQLLQAIIADRDSLVSRIESKTALYERRIEGMQSEISKLRSALEKAGNVERRAEVAELDAATLRGQLSESQKGLIERYKKAMRAERSAISREEAAGRSDIEARRLFEDAVESISYTEKHKLVATESVVRAGLMQSESDTRVGLMSQLIHSVSGDAGPEALARLEEIIDKFGKAAKGRLEASESQMRSLESQNAEISEELDVMRAYKDMFFEEQRRNEGLTKTIKGLERQKNILERRFAEQGSGTPVRPGTNPTTPHSARRATPGASLRTPGRQ